MPLHLAYFPTEILVNIFKRVPALNIYLATHLCGDRLIKTKAVQGGVTSVHLAAQSLQKLGLKFLSDFRGLVRVSIDCIEHEGPLDLHELPSTIRELEIRGDCTHWLAARPHPEFCSVAPNMLFHENNLMPFNFKRHFHDLLHLRLQCRCDKLNRRLTTTIPMTLLIQCLLPPSLLTLSISHLAQIDPIFWGNLPSSLEITSLQSKLQTNWLERIIAAAPQVRFKHLQLLDLVTDPAFIRKIPSKSVSMRLNVMRPELLNDLVNLFPLASTDSSPPFEPQLTSVTTVRWDFSPDVRCTAGSLKFPPALNSIEDLNAYDAKWTNFNALPSGITALKAATDSNNALVLPSKLRSLELALFTAAEHLPQVVSSLPAFLTSADLALQSTPLRSSEISAALPRSLTFLKLRFPLNAEAELLDEPFFTSLPQTLTAVQINAPCKDATLIYVPKSITNLVLGRIEISGALYSTTETIFNYADIGYLRRLANGVFHYKAQISCDKDWNESFKRTPTYSVLKPVWLPTSITRMQIGSRAHYGRAKQWPAINLPNLTSLQIPTFSDFALQDCSTPSLTLLSICRNVYYDEFTFDFAYPTSITHLQYLNGATDANCFPRSLQPQIRILEVKDMRLISIQQLPHLLTADVRWAISGPHTSNDLLLAIPSTITSLTLRLTYPGSDIPQFKDFLAQLPHLTAINFKHPDWCMQESDLLSVPCRIQSVTCEAVSIIDPLSYLPFCEKTMDDNTFDFTRSVLGQLKHKFSFLHFETPRPAIFFPLKTNKHFKKMTENWPATLSRATFDHGVTFLPRFGRFLPRTSLTSLDVLGASGIAVTSAAHLPETLTELKICSRRFPLLHYKMLPRGIKTLHLKAGKFLNHHAHALPPTLQELTLEYTVLGERTLSLLPNTLEHLTLPSLRNLRYLYRGFASPLKTITTNLFLKVDFFQLPGSLEDLREINGLQRRSSPKDRFLKTLTADELLAYLSKVKP